jgi:hypothetical protein
MPSLTKNSGRQEVISAIVDFTFADAPTTATAYDAIDLPVNAIVVGGDLVVTTAWNTATSATLAVGDVTTTNRYLAATDLKTVGRTPLVPTGFTHTSVENLLKGLTAFVGAAATAGAARLRVDYIVKGRARFSTGLGR